MSLKQLNLLFTLLIHLYYFIRSWEKIFHRFAFEQETTENRKKEGQRLKEEISNLTDYLVPDTDIEIEFCVKLTLIDGHTRVS